MNVDAELQQPRFGTGATTVLVLFGLACMGLLAWLATTGPALDEATARERVVEIRSRKSAPIEPLPVVRARVTTDLAMERDPFR